MRHHTRHASPITALAVALASLVAAVAAGAKAPPPTPIAFARGASSAELHGGIARGETARYTFGAREDQWAELAVRSVEGNAVIKVYAPGWQLGGEDGSEIVGGEGMMDPEAEEDVRSWSGLLPSSGTYLVEVGSERGGADFHLALTLRAPKEADCQDLAQQPMNACFGAISRDVEAARASVYAGLEKGLEPAEKALLAAAEAAWRAYRDADCRYEAGFYEGGSLQPTIYGNCLIRLTTQRRTELEQQLQDHAEQ